MLQPGGMIGSYRLKHIIGSGNSANVYLAQSVVSPFSEVAIKIRLRTQGQHERILAQRFTESARLHYMFSHPNIAWLHESLEDEKYQAVVIEYLPGGTLSDLLKSRQKLSIDEACLLGAHLADGLEHMHDIQVIHRDIKPDNILFLESHKLASVRVADFDVSKNPYTSPNITEKGAHVGTLCYIAPEQFNQEKSRASADVYSLGMVIFETIAGRLPYESVSMPAIFSRFLDDKPLPPLSAFQPNSSKALDWILERAITTQVVERIPSAATLAILLLATSVEARSLYPRLRELRLQTRTPWLQRELSSAPFSVQQELLDSLREIGLNL